MFTAEQITFLKENQDQDPEAILLSKALTHKGWDTKTLARQLKGMQVARSKFPFLYVNDEIVYPSAISLEQASSEITARFKSELVKANRIIDLSGGMGVDTYFFSKNCKELIYVEPQQELVDLAKHNFNCLGATHIHSVCSTALDFLNTYKVSCDLVYLDPSRRKSGKRVADYKEWEPDIVGLKPLIWTISDRIMIKLSPMTDIREACKELGEVKEVYVVSDRNECKEVLLLLQKNHQAEPLIHAVLLQGEKHRRYSFTYAQEQAAEPVYGDVLSYIYEPDVALLKAGAFKKLAVDTGLKKIHPHTHLYTSEQEAKDFLGKTFQVKELREYSRKNVEELLEKKKDFHVLTRNATVTSDQVKKQYKLIERGDHYLLIFKGQDGSLCLAKSIRLR